MEDEALSFFDSMFETIPGPFRLVPKDYRDDEEMDDGAPKKKKVHKRNKDKGEIKQMSMVELKQRAQSKIEGI